MRWIPWNTADGVCGWKLVWRLRKICNLSRGALLSCLLDGTALETVEHLTLDQLKEENGDKHLWKALDERFPDKLKHDWLAECLKEVFTLSQSEGETIVAWTSKVQEAFAKCRRKVEVDFPSEVRGWICLNASGLSEDQRAIVTAKTQGDFKIETVVAAMRSFSGFQSNCKTNEAEASYSVLGSG